MTSDKVGPQPGHDVISVVKQRDVGGPVVARKFIQPRTLAVAVP